MTKNEDMNKQLLGPPRLRSRSKSLPKRPVEHLLLPDKQFSMLAPNPPSEPSKFAPPCLIFVGRTSNILLVLTAILGIQEIWPVSGSIWKSSSGFTHGPEIKDILYNDFVVV